MGGYIKTPNNKSSAVAEMGGRLGTIIDMGRRVEGGAPWGKAGSP